MMSVCQNTSWELIMPLLVIIGWIVVYQLNKKNEILKEARSYRIEMLRAFMNLVLYIEKENNFTGPEPPNEYGHDSNRIPAISDWVTVLFQIRMYGKDDEIRQYESIISEVQEVLCNDEPVITDIQFKKIKKSMKELEKLCINRIREELNPRGRWIKIRILKKYSI